MEEDHFNLVTNCRKKLDADNHCKILTKFHFAQQRISWLGYNKTQSSISALEAKLSAIFALKQPNTLEKFHSFLGSVLYNSEFIPNLAQISNF